MKRNLLKYNTYVCLFFLLTMFLFAGCGGSGSGNSGQTGNTEQNKGTSSNGSTGQNSGKDNSPYTGEVNLSGASLEEEMAAFGELPPIPEVLRPEASGVAVQENAQAKIDYSNVAEGYVMVQFTAETEKRLKVQIKGPTTTYKYDIKPGEWEVFPISDGNGDYQIGVYENVEDSKYALALAAKVSVELIDEFAPFLRPNQYVDYADAQKTKQMAAILTKDDVTELDKVASVYDYVVSNLTYDEELAASVKSGYLPVLDEVLEKKTGICFDYAALMTGMLRSQSVPCKLVVGYAGEAYHAWINVYTEKDGWIDNVIYFDGTTWMRMDPTFASSGNRSDKVMKYIGDGTNYTVKYLY